MIDFLAFLVGLAVIAVFPITAILVVRANPQGSPARARRPIHTWQLMALTVAVALCFGLSPIPLLAFVSSVAVVSLAFWPWPLLWQTLEMAATAWLLAFSIIGFSNIGPDFGSAIAILLFGPFLCLSWLLRMCLRWERPRSRAAWSSLLLLPASALVFFALIPTGLAVKARLAASEPALRAFALKAPPGYKQWEPQRVGLFWTQSSQERDGCVLWTTSFFFSGAGLVYIPGETPPAWAEYRFERIRGPWWKFWEYP